MNAVEWPNTVNKKVYDIEKGYASNAVSIKFDSGREIRHAQNTKCERIYTVNLSLTRQEEKEFDVWYADVLGGDAGTFLFPSLELDGTMQEYRMTQPPQISGQAYKHIKMEWQQV